MKKLYLLSLTMLTMIYSSCCDDIKGAYNSAPIADAGPDQVALVNESVMLDANGSTDYDGDQLTYNWNLDYIPDGSSAALSEEKEVQAIFSPDKPGRYLVSLFVDDGILQSTIDYTVVKVFDSESDQDGDGIITYRELALGTDPNDRDSDDDGLLDGEEDSNHNGIIESNETNPLLIDSDSDNIQDGTESGVSIPDEDTNTDIFIPDLDPTSVTNPLKKDTDNGGIDDGVEDSNYNGRVDIGETDPSLIDDDDGDTDGINYGIELMWGSDPFDPDSDDDGLLDGEEDANANGIYDVGETQVMLWDTDGDGLADGLERGLDTPRIGTDVGIFAADQDIDSTTNPAAYDSDNGGVADGLEDKNGNGLIDENETDPNDPTDDDLDQDGLSPAQESALGTNPLVYDSDTDGIGDGDEVKQNTYGVYDVGVDTDPNDPDTDGDGILDGAEIRHLDPTSYDAPFDTNPLAVDTDMGSTPDGDEEAIIKDGIWQFGESNPRDASDDLGAINVSDDPDGDCLSNEKEFALGTDPYDYDSDDDGLPDGGATGEDKNCDGIIESTGLDGVAMTLDDNETSPTDIDTDGDGIADGVEVGNTSYTDHTLVGNTPIIDLDPSTTTDPNDPDTDNGGVDDGGEDWNKNGRVDGIESDPVGTPDDDYRSYDQDQDGLVFALEEFIGTSPTDIDSDDDGLKDGDEIFIYHTNPLKRDTDNDRLQDGCEVGMDMPFGIADPDGTGIIEATEQTSSLQYDHDPSTTTNPLMIDTDGGGVPDGWEDVYKDGEYNALDGDTRPTDPGDDDEDYLPLTAQDKLTDQDTDQLSLSLEVALFNLRSRDQDADIDDDGIPDGLEIELMLDPTNPDTDNDGILDGVEYRVQVPIIRINPINGTEINLFVNDQDAKTFTDPLLFDTDGDGQPDGAEDINGNGRVDPGEQDPNDPNG